MIVNEINIHQIPIDVAGIKPSACITLDSVVTSQHKKSFQMH